MHILVSACLLGTPCRYNGKGVLDPAVQVLMREHQLVPVCPERLGGLEAPREPSEISGGRVFGRDGRDVSITVTGAHPRAKARALSTNIRPRPRPRYAVSTTTSSIHALRPVGVV